LSDKDFKVKNKLIVNGLNNASGVVLATNNQIDSHTLLPTQYGGTGTTTSPTSGQVLYSTSGTTYAPTTLNSLVPPTSYSADAPASPSVGQIWVESDSTSDSFDPNIIRRKSFTATAAQTVFTTDLEFIQGYEQVFFNGMLLLRNSDYTTASNTNVTLASGAAAGDIVEIVSITNLNSINTATTTTNTFTGAQTIAGNVVVGGTVPNLSSSTKAITVDSASGSDYAALEIATGGVLRGYLNATNGAMYIASVGSNPLVTYTNSVERMRIDSSGNTLIGTNSGPGKLRVNQSGQSTTAHFDNTNASWASDVVTSYSPGGVETSVLGISARSDGSSWLTSSYGALVLRTGASNSPSERMRITASGDVQIANNTIDTLRYFDIYNTHSGASAGAIIRLITNNAANTAVTTVDMVKYRNGTFLLANNDTGATAIFQFNNAGAERMRIDGNGSLLVGYTGTNSASYKLQVNSQIFATSSSIATSDGRYKENVNTITSGLDIVDSLRPVSFTWKDHPVHNFVAGKTVGFIAQEVKESLSQYDWIDNIIKTNTSDAILDEDGNELTPAEEFLGIAESNIIPLLVAAVKELKTRVETLEAK
jgi:hypothetical protein